MSKAYAWAFSNPVRKVFYNMTVTGLSVVIALGIGVLELLQILIQTMDLQGQPWDAIAGWDFIGQAGFLIVGLFVVTWIVALLVYRLGRIEERWGAMVEQGEPLIERAD